MAWRREMGVPDDARQRMKWALKSGNKERWTWEYGRTYGVDFFNPYIDFNEFSLRLPGFTLPIMKYWDGQGLRYVFSFFLSFFSFLTRTAGGALTHTCRHKRKRSHQLRYVLRNRATEQVYLVVVFTLHLAEDVNEDGSLKPGALEENGEGVELPLEEPELELEPDDEDFREEEALGEARRRLSKADLNGEGTTEEDLD
jgi:hypothetical protein